MRRGLFAQKFLRLLFVLFIVGFSSTVVLGQTISVNAPNTVVANERFSVQYSLDNIEPSGSPSEISYPGLEMLYGPAMGQSSQVYNINGKITSKKSYTYTYTFLAEREGTFFVKGFSIPTKSGVMSARTVKIKVLGSSQSGGGEASSLKPFLSTELSKKKIYLNEAVVITHKLYIDNLRFRYDPLAPIEYKGFITQNIKVSRDDILDKAKIKGNIYNALTLAKDIIIPNKVGKVNISSVRSSIYVPVPSNDIFFSTEERELILKSKEKTLNILPLPTEGRPIDYSGAVGDFTIKCSFDEAQGLETNKAFNIKVHIQGQGNLKSATIPKMNFPTSFETYPATSEQNMYYDKTTNRIISKSDIEYTFIPRDKGQFTIPELSFSFFNPNKDQYETIRTEEFTLSVKQGEKISNQGIIQEANYSDNILSKYHQHNASDDFVQDLSKLSFWYFGAYLLMIVLTILAVFLILRYRALRQDVLSFKSKKANTIALKRLKQAKAFADNNKPDTFYEELLRALWGYIGDKFSMPISALSRENIQSLFEEKGFEDSLAKEYCFLIDELEFTRYTPQQGQRQLQDLYDKALDLILMIEKNK